MDKAIHDVATARSVTTWYKNGSSLDKLRLAILRLDILKTEDEWKETDRKDRAERVERVSAKCEYKKALVSLVEHEEEHYNMVYGAIDEYLNSTRRDYYKESYGRNGKRILGSLRISLFEAIHLFGGSNQRLQSRRVTYYIKTKMDEYDDSMNRSSGDKKDDADEDYSDEKKCHTHEIGDGMTSQID